LTSWCVTTHVRQDRQSHLRHKLTSVKHPPGTRAGTRRRLARLTSHRCHAIIQTPRRDSLFLPSSPSASSPQPLSPSIPSPSLPSSPPVRTAGGMSRPVRRIPPTCPVRQFVSVGTRVARQLARCCVLSDVSNRRRGGEEARRLGGTPSPSSPCTHPTLRPSHPPTRPPLPSLSPTHPPALPPFPPSLPYHPPADLTPPATPPYGQCHEHQPRLLAPRIPSSLTRSPAPLTERHEETRMHTPRNTRQENPKEKAIISTRGAGPAAVMPSIRTHTLSASPSSMSRIPNYNQTRTASIEKRKCMRSTLVNGTNPRSRLWGSGVVGSALGFRV